MLEAGSRFKNNRVQQTEERGLLCHLNQLLQLLSGPISSVLLTGIKITAPSLQTRMAGPDFRDC